MTMSEIQATDKPIKCAQVTRAHVLDTAKGYVSQDRQADHGAPENTFQTHADLWTAYIKGKTGQSVNLTAVDVAAMMVLFKMGRVAANPNHLDNWIDSAGYSACGGELANA